MVKEFKGQSGKRIVINVANFRESAQLKSCIAKELLKQEIDLTQFDSFESLKKEFNKLKDILLGFEISEEFNAALFDCLRHCTYDSIQIKEQLFDDVPEAREDYYMIAFECIKENIYPFIKGLLSKLNNPKPIKE